MKDPIRTQRLLSKGNRAATHIIVTQIGGVDAVHFCNTKLRGDDIWFPVQAEGHTIHDRVFKTVEQLMTMHRVAHNVVHVHKTNEFSRGDGHFCCDYDVIYNLPEEN